MSGFIKVDSKGRIVLPEVVRSSLKISPGSWILLNTEGDIILIRRSEKRGFPYSKNIRRI